MPRLIGVLLCLVFVLGCGGIQVKEPVTPPGCEKSLIYPIKTEWVIGAGVVKIGVIEVVKNNLWLKQPVMDTIDELASGLKPDETIGYDPTYAGFAISVLAKLEFLNRYLSGGSLIVAGDVITQTFTGVDVPIDACDRLILLRDLGQLKMLIGTIE